MILSRRRDPDRKLLFDGQPAGADGRHFESYLVSTSQRHNDRSVCQGVSTRQFWGGVTPAIYAN